MIRRPLQICVPTSDRMNELLLSLSRNSGTKDISCRRIFHPRRDHAPCNLPAGRHHGVAATETVEILVAELSEDVVEGDSGHGKNRNVGTLMAPRIEGRAIFARVDDGGRGTPRRLPGAGGPRRVVFTPGGF